MIGKEASQGSLVVLKNLEALTSSNPPSNPCHPFNFTIKREERNSVQLALGVGLRVNQVGRRME